MENNELKQPDKKGPPRWLIILLLGIEILAIGLVSLTLITTASQFIEIFKGLELPLPFITIALVQYWYLWIILLGVLFVTGILIEIFAKGKGRWGNVILSSFTMLLCGFIFLAFIFAVFQPIFAIQQTLSK
jgi:hypothetical protein